MSQKDYYEILGVEKGADEAKIKKAYKRLAMKYHPDRNKDDKAVQRKSLKRSEKLMMLFLIHKNVLLMTNLVMPVLNKAQVVLVVVALLGLVVLVIFSVTFLEAVVQNLITVAQTLDMT